MAAREATRRLVRRCTGLATGPRHHSGRSPMTRVKVPVDGRSAIVSGARVGDRAGCRPATRRPWLPGCDRRRGRDGAAPDRRAAAGPGAGPQARRPRSARPDGVRHRSGGVGSGAAGDGVQQRRRVHVAKRRRRLGRGRRVGVRDQFPRCRQWRPRVSAVPPAPALRGDRQHLERVGLLGFPYRVLIAPRSSPSAGSPTRCARSSAGPACSPPRCIPAA
jgi:hypothetical protein